MILNSDFKIESPWSFEKNTYACTPFQINSIRMPKHWYIIKVPKAFLNKYSELGVIDIEGVQDSFSPLLS